MIDCSISNDSVCTLKGYIPSFQTSTAYRAKFTYYLSISQEAAALHARGKGVDAPSLLKTNRSWVILYSNINVYRYIVWPDEWFCRTFIVPERNPALSRRIVECFDKDGKKIFDTDSLWSVVKISPDGHKVLIGAKDIFEKIGYYTSADYGQFDRLKHFKIDNPTYKRSITVSAQDRDINEHANNISYVSWVLDSIPQSRLDEHKIKKAMINWSSEIYIGQSVDIAIDEKESATSREFMADISNKAYVNIVQDK